MSDADDLRCGAHAMTSPPTLDQLAREVERAHRRYRRDCCSEQTLLPLLGALGAYLTALRGGRRRGKVNVLVSADVAEAVIGWVKQGRPPVSADLPAQYVAGLAMCELAEALGVDRNAGLTEKSPC